MDIKHKILKDFQLTTNDKKIVTLKAKTIIINYRYVTKTEDILLEQDVINNNAEFFQLIDWKDDLTVFLKQNDILPALTMSKKISPFIEEVLKNNKEVIEINEVDNTLEILLDEKNNLIKKLETELKSHENKKEENVSNIKDISPNSINKDDVVKIISKYATEGRLSLEFWGPEIINSMIKDITNY
jgi:hypothetical protein